MAEKTLGQVGYDAYGMDSGWLTFDGRAMPRWTQEEVDAASQTCTVLTDVIKARWEVAAKAIEERVMLVQRNALLTPVNAVNGGCTVRKL